MESRFSRLCNCRIGLESTIRKHAIALTGEANNSSVDRLPAASAEQNDTRSVWLRFVYYEGKESGS